MNKTILAIICLIVQYASLHAQALMGNVLDEHKQPIIGAILQWQETGVTSTTNENGYFRIERKHSEHKLIVSFIGYQKDTIEIKDSSLFELVTLREGIELAAVQVESQRKSNTFSRLNPLNIEALEEKEFKKAACCSVAESFQTSNAVDISYNNAATGNKEIQFLGLRGLYTQLLIENRESFGGILSSMGYEFIPGTWLEQVNIQKGASTVKNGAQSMAGAINIQLKKPFKDDPAFINLFGDLHGRYEANVHLNKKWNDRQSSGLYLNGAFQSKSRDHNGDFFQDEAKINRINGLFKNILFGHVFEGQINGQALYEERNSGQIQSDNPYVIKQKVHHFNLFGNLGYVRFDKENQSAGSIYDISHSRIDAIYGNQAYKANETRASFQLLYNHPFGYGRHQLIMGPNGSIHRATEEAFQQKWKYDEQVLGLFFEYTYKSSTDPGHRFSASLGMRNEWIRNSQPMFIPRASLRYLFAEDWTFRASIGRGYRFQRLFADHAAYFASSKQWIIESPPSIEKSWNTGFNIVGKPYLNGREAEINVDAYLTWFDDQVIADVDQDYTKIFLYNLNGNSRAYQTIATISYPVLSWMNVKIGGKYTDTRAQYKEGFKQVPLFPKFRGLISIDLESSNKKWLVNISSNYVGEMRLPDKENVPNDILHGHVGFSKPYMLLQTQLNWISRSWELYAGCENLLNYTQHTAIIDAANPFGNYFNAAEIYAPVSGIKPYLGIKWRIPNLD